MGPPSEKLIDFMSQTILSLSFLCALPSTLLCSWCTRPLRRPVQLSCGHRVDRDCLESTNQSCPNCHEAIENSFPDRSAVRELMALDVFCVARADGCSWAGRFDALSDHLEGCGHRMDTQESVAKCDYGLELETSNTQLDRNGEALDRMEGETNDARTKFDRLFGSYEEMHARVDDVEADLSLMKMRKLREEMRKLTTIVLNGGSRIEKVGAGAGENKHISVEVAALSRLSLQNEVRISACDAQQREFDLKLRLYQSSSFSGHYVWKLDNLEKRFNDALTGSVLELFTPPLYTTAYGYKYCCKVMLNGDSKASNSLGSHVAVYFLLMQGDFDEVLCYPFPYNVRISLLDQQSSPARAHNIVREIKAEDSLPFHRPIHEMGPGVGFPQFCRHDVLYDTKYSRDGCIFFRIDILHGLT